MSSSQPSLEDLKIERSAAPERSGRRWLSLAILIFTVVVALLAWAIRRPRAIEVRTVAARDLTSTSGAERTVLNASGYVTARRAATVSSKVTGKVMEVLVEEGMRVSEGQVLARLDDTNVRASLKLADAQQTAAKAAREETRVRIREAEQNLKRITDLARNSISAKAELEHAEAEEASLKARLAQQEAEVAVAEQQVATWKQQLDDTTIRAPFAGIVTSKNAQPGEMISPMSAGGFTRTGICTMVDMESLEIEIDVNESYINRVEPGQAVEAALDAYPEWKLPCKVIAIIPSADRQKSTVKVRVGFDKLDRRILPEMGVKVAFREAGGGPSAAAAVRVVAVPKSAVQQHDGKDVVLVVQNGRAERRAVKIASASATDAVLSAGVAAGERVIAEPTSGVVDGVVVREAPAAK